MRTLFISIILLLSQSTGAQIVTGGGTTVFDDGGGGADAAIAFQTQMYVSQLNLRTFTCYPAGFDYFSYTNIVDAYLKLSMRKIKLKSNPSCGFDQNVFRCIHDHNTKKQFHQLSHQPTFKKYIQSTYHLKLQTANELIRFFESLDEAPN